MLLQPEDFSIRVKQSHDHDIGDSFATKNTNSSPKEPAHLQLMMLAFFRWLVYIHAKDDTTPTKSACRFMHTPQTIVFEQYLSKFLSMQHKWYGLNQLVETGLLFWHCVHDQQTRFDRLSPDMFLIFQLLYHNLYQVQQKC